MHLVVFAFCSFVFNIFLIFFFGLELAIPSCDLMEKPQSGNLFNWIEPIIVMVENLYLQSGLRASQESPPQNTDQKGALCIC